MKSETLQALFPTVIAQPFDPSSAQSWVGQDASSGGTQGCGEEQAWTLHLANCFKEILNFLPFLHIEILHVVSVDVEGKDSTIWYSKYHSSWLLGFTRSLGISRHGVLLHTLNIQLSYVHVFVFHFWTTCWTWYHGLPLCHIYILI